MKKTLVLPNVKLPRKKFSSFLDKLISIFPPLGSVLSSIFGAQEYYMLEFFRKLDKKFKINSLNLANKYIMKGRFGGRVIPLNHNFEIDSSFLPTEEILKILKRSKVRSISKCYCRETQLKYGKKMDYKYPIRTCIHIGLGKNLKEIPSKSENLKKVTKEEIEDLLHKCDDLGLIHQLIFFPNPQYYYVVCNCDPHYCVVLNGFLKLGYPQMIKSDFIAKIDWNLCINCGECEQWCHFKARKIKNGALVFDDTICFGCGICLSKCPSKAISLVRR